MKRHNCHYPLAFAYSYLAEWACSLTRMGTTPHAPRQGKQCSMIIRRQGRGGFSSCLSGGPLPQLLHCRGLSAKHHYPTREEIAARHGGAVPPIHTNNLVPITQVYTNEKGRGEGAGRLHNREWKIDTGSEECDCVSGRDREREGGRRREGQR